MGITTPGITLCDITLKRAEFTAWEPKTTVPAGYIDMAAELTAGSEWFQLAGLLRATRGVVGRAQIIKRVVEIGLAGELKAEPAFLLLVAVGLKAAA